MTNKRKILYKGITAFVLLITFVSTGYAKDRHNNDFGVFYDAFSAIQNACTDFRHNTFGDEAFWTDTLQLHDAIAGEALGGVGDGISPATALAVGLKVDVKALPRKLRRALRKGKVDLTSPATTLALNRPGFVGDSIS